ncbi:AAA family ATPase [Nocardioides ferulae]|uniref:AAA family ATPase n=1 Tax=Nocardioides ferulae TaxID=2340821 RepID=UPI000EB3EE27|nr:hypothetical protein [Nocardioides ferulae]
MVIVLIVASGAAWESTVLQLLGEHPGVVVLKRCVDVDDLLASAASGQADVAVVGLDAPGLDLAAVDHLRRHGVRPVAIAPGDASHDAARLRASRIGVPAVVPDTELARVPEAVTAAGSAPSAGDLDAAVGVGDPVVGLVDGAEDGVPPGPPGGRPGRVIAVWGPAGAPGRTTLAVTVAAELARRRRRTVLVDADPWGGAVAQQLGILDEVSGLLAAARLAGSGALADRLGTVLRAVDGHLAVVTGLPRPDRWAEVRAGSLEHLLDVARGMGEVVVDTGFCLEDDPVAELGSRPGRNAMTLGALDVADLAVVVGAADPVGLSRLARGLVDLRDRAPGLPVHVVVNRMRPTLGWSTRDIAGMVSGVARVAGLHFLPEDRAAVDRALVTGRSLVEVGDSPLARAVAGLVDVLEPAGAGAAAGRTGRVRRRRAGTTRPR